MQKCRYATINSFIVAFLVFMNAEAAQWTLDPGLELQLIHTDNINLSAPGAEVSDSITSIAPTLEIRGQGARTNLNLDYRYERLFYSEYSDQDNAFQQYLTTFHGLLIDEILFLDMQGALTQVAINTRNPTPIDNIHITNNQTDVLNYSVSPYIHTRRSSGTEFMFRPTFGANEYEDVESLNNKTYQYEIFYQHASPAENRGWLIRSTSNQIQYEDGDESKLSAVNLETYFQILRRVNMLAGVGYEDNEYDQASGGGEIDGSNWMFGLSWNPNRRISLEARIGERFFGSTGSFNLTRRGRHSLWLLSYGESIDPGGQAITASNIETIGDRLPEVEVSIVNRVSTDYTYDKAKSRVNINATKEHRDYQLSDSTEDILTGRITYSYRITGQSSAELDINRIRHKYVTDNRVDIDSTYSITLNHRLGREINSSIIMQRLQRESDMAINEYFSNVFRVRITAIF